MKNKHTLFCLLSLFALTSCTKIFFAINDSSEFKRMRMAYKGYSNCEYRNSKFYYYSKKGTIQNINRNMNDTTCMFDFELNPKQNLPLTNFIRIQNIKTSPMEERLLCIMIENQNGVTCDTILYKIGEKEIVNKFSERNKFFGLIGKKTYVYYYSK